MNLAHSYNNQGGVDLDTFPPGNKRCVGVSFTKFRSVILWSSLCIGIGGNKRQKREEEDGRARTIM